MSALEAPDPSKVYDNALSWTTPSDTDPHVSYHQELADYSCNGACSCDNFKFEFEGLLAKGITPAEAIERGLIKFPPKKDPKKHPDDALRCKHLIRCRRAFADAAIQSLAAAQKAHRS